MNCSLFASRRLRGSSHYGGDEHEQEMCLPASLQQHDFAPCFTCERGLLSVHHVRILLANSVFTLRILRTLAQNKPGFCIRQQYRKGVLAISQVDLIEHMPFAPSHSVER
jgi:hypothetical protein